MKVSNGELIRKIDDYSINSLGIPSIVLMENAALKVIENIDIEENDRYVIVCGRGNNGGDGLAVARQLIAIGKRVSVFSVGLNSMSKDCAINHDILCNMGVKITNISNVEDLEFLRSSIGRSDMVVDAMFGIGLKRDVRGIYEMAINVINGTSKKIVAIDVPSGFKCDSGEVLGNCIQANKTVSFETYKKGFLKYGSHKYTGEVVVEKIGIPEYVVDKFHSREYFIEKSFIKKSFEPREYFSHKGNFGHAAILAGSDGMTGAALIATKSAVKSGAGLTTLISTQSGIESAKGFVPEAMWSTFDQFQKNTELLSKCNTIAIGPGMGKSDMVKKYLESILMMEDKTVVIDADGLNVLSKNMELLKRAKGKVVLTPHPGEMARLCNLAIDEIQKDRIAFAKGFAKDYNVILVLKGYNTIITDGEVAYINPTGNGAMANGGMGDCLTGIISSLSAQGYGALEASYIGAYIHGLCGDRLAKEKFVVTATDIIDNISATIKEFV